MHNSTSIFSKVLSFILIIVFIQSMVACSNSNKLKDDDLQEVTLQTNLNEINSKLGYGATATIYYNQPDYKTYAQQIDYLLNVALVKTAKYIEPRPGLNIEIILIDDDIFRARITSAHWVTAAFHKGRIFIPINEKRKPNFEALGFTITHELTHAITHDLSGGNIPAWLDEGIALVAENQLDAGADKRYREWLRTNQPIKLANLEQGFTKLHFDDAGYAYIQSKFVVNYLLIRFGRKGLQTLIENFKKIPDTKSAFKASFGITLEQFEEFFENRLRASIRAGTF